MLVYHFLHVHYIGVMYHVCFTLGFSCATFLTRNINNNNDPISYFIWFYRLQLTLKQTLFCFLKIHFVTVKVIFKFCTHDIRTRIGIRMNLLFYLYTLINILNGFSWHIYKRKVISLSYKNSFMYTLYLLCFLIF